MAESCVHKDAVLGVTFTSNSLQVVSVGQDSLAKVLTLPTLEQVRIEKGILIFDYNFSITVQ